MRVDTERSSLTFVRPFLFDPGQATLALFLIATAKFEDRDRKLLVWEPVEFPTADRLPHIADSLVSTPGSPAIAAAFRLTNDFVQSGQGLGGKAFEYVPKKSPNPVSLKIDELQIILFRDGVGFVVQRWKVQSDSPAVWLDLQHYGRFADPKRTCPLRRPNDPAVTSFADLNTTALDTLAHGLDRIAVHDVFIAGRMLPYAVVFLTSGPDPVWHPEKVLYKLRRLFHATQPYHPNAEQVALAPPNFHPYLKDQWFFQSLEGGGFAAVDAPTDGFFKNDLPKHLTTEYFLLFVLALHQRFTLMDLSAEVARRGHRTRPSSHGGNCGGCSRASVTGCSTLPPGTSSFRWCSGRTTTACTSCGGRRSRRRNCTRRCAGRCGR